MVLQYLQIKLKTLCKSVVFILGNIHIVVKSIYRGRSFIVDDKQIFASVEVCDHEVRMVVGEFFSPRLNILKVEIICYIRTWY